MLSSFGFISNKIKLGVVTDDEVIINREFGMYLQSEENMYFLYQLKNVSYGFTNKAIISKTPTTTDVKETRHSITRYPFTQYFVTATDIQQGIDDIDIDVKFELNPYANQQRGTRLGIELSIGVEYKDYAVMIYKLLAFLQEKQHEQKDVEKNLLEITTMILNRNSHTLSTLSADLQVTKDWLLHNVYTTQFANIHHLFEDALKGFILHKNIESEGALFNNLRRHFEQQESPKQNSDPHYSNTKKEDIIDVEAEIVEER